MIALDIPLARGQNSENFVFLRVYSGGRGGVYNLTDLSADTNTSIIICMKFEYLFLLWLVKFQEKERHNKEINNTDKQTKIATETEPVF